MDKLFHYTKIETLALILSSKHMQFNALSNVDDIEESQSDDEFDIGKSVLVSCWSNSSEENLALWKMYSNDFYGCRIEIERDFFEIQDEIMNTKPDNILALTQIQRDIGGLIIIPKYFFREMKYVSKFSERKLFKGDTMNINFLGIEKKKEWAFQQEYRFYIQQLPGNATRYKYDYYDLRIKDNSFDNIKILLGPKCNEGHYVIVKMLLEKFTENGKVEYSSFKGKIN